jgi:hypothetical protein
VISCPPAHREPVGLDPVAEDNESVRLGDDPQCTTRLEFALDDDVPVAGEGHASRTNQTSRGSAGAGRSSVECDCCETDRHQPVAPVPVETMRPDDDCRSSAPSGRSLYRAD